MADKQQARGTRTAARPMVALYPYQVAVLTRPDGPYEAGQAVTVDPGAPWAKGNPPTFQGDEERMRSWRDAGSPLFVDHGRFNTWEREGYFSERKGGQE